MKKFSILSTALLFCVTCFSQAFTPDPSFGSVGKVYTNLVDINKSDEVATAIAMQADGKIVVAGSTIAPAIILRRNADGSPDNSFGKNGTVTIFAWSIKALAIQPDGKILAAGGSNSDMAVLRLNIDGSPDNSFDGDGRMVIPVGPGADLATGIAIQDDGKIVVTGYGSNGANNDFFAVRLNSNGSTDNSFDGDGKVMTDIGGGSDVATGLAIQADGKIVVSGHSYNGSTYDFAILRYTTNGSPDNTFDGDGKLITSIPAGSITSTSVRLQTDQKILIGGFVSDISSSWKDFILCRYNSDGSPDNNFDGDGIVRTDVNHNDELNAIGIQNDSKIVVTGYSGGQSALLRFTVNGVLDNSFDGDGILMAQVGYNYNRSTCFAIQADGKIVAAGKTENQNGTWEDLAVARFNTNGTFDNSFDGDGQVTIDIYSSDDHVGGMAVQTDGKILVAGYSYTVVTNDDIRARRFTLARYNTDGTLDNSFGTGGRVMTDFGGSENYSAAIAIQSDGKIVLAGTNLAQNYDFALVRYNTDGSLDNTFDGDGKATVSMSSREDGVSALIIQSDGKIIAGGFARNANNSGSDFAVARFNTNGSLDNSFDGDGKLILVVGAASQISSLAVQNDGKILLGGYSNNGSSNDFALVRLTTNGGIDNSFDGDGIVTTDISAVNNYIRSMAIQNDGKIVVAGYTLNGSIHDFALARYNTNGSLDNTFDGDGIVITSAAGGIGYLTTMIIQNNGQILAGGPGNNGSNTDFALVRYNSNGSLDNTFDGDGKAMYGFELGSSEACYAMQLRGNRIYLAGDITTAGRSDFALMAVLNDILSSPLPLQLRDFSGKRVNNDALLTWKTENEVDMLEYTVERSIDGRNYTSAGTVAAMNRTNIYNYYFTDANIISFNVPVIYYRLKEKGIDGKISYSRIVALTLDKNNNLVLFYPNPVINEANIALTVNRQDKLQVRVIDNKGRIVKQQQWNVTAGSTSLSLDVASLAKGIYYVEIKGESIDYKKQFVK